MKLTLVLLAAGISSRYGKLKQLDEVGPGREALMDYAVFDAITAGFSKVVFVIREQIERQIREHIEPRFAGAIPIAFAHQSLEDVPAGHTPSPTRQKPWGTAHAILAAEHEIEGSFAVCNADDYYGFSAYDMLAKHLAAEAVANDDAKAAIQKSWAPDPARAQYVPHALVGYRLRDTLSEFGGVTRAICASDPDGYLQQLVEVEQIQERGGSLDGFAESGERISLDGEELVSMNLWGFTGQLLPILRGQFEEFLAANEDSPTREFLIPTALSQQIARNQAKIRVLRTEEQWFGLTFSEDRERVIQRLRDLVRQGRYPECLATALDK
jgi:hypothetical protein